MLKSVKIENFRGFKSFELQQLGRINLLVGENNSGKTSICNLKI
jgi:AAA15 family ATPase/GTPase